MQEGMSYFKDSNDFIHKIRDLKDIPKGALPVTANVVGLYPTHASIFMDEIETNFLDTQEFKPLVRFRYIDDVFFI